MPLSPLPSGTIIHQVPPLTEFHRGGTRRRAPQPVPFPQQTPLLTTPELQPVAPAQAPGTDGTGTQTAVLASLVLQYTNDARVQKNLPPLAYNALLQRVAQDHSLDMLTQNYFDHTDKNGCSPSCRISNAGYVWQSVGENIHEMSGYNLAPEDTAHKIVNDWLNSPEHRDNLLSARYTEVGIGIAGQGSTIYTTADYGLAR
jgi:uncharacterized protein YkwD